MSFLEQNSRLFSCCRFFAFFTTKKPVISRLFKFNYGHCIAQLRRLFAKKKSRTKQAFCLFFFRSAVPSELSQELALLILKGKKAAYISRALHISRATYYRELPQAMRIAEVIFKKRSCLKNSVAILYIYYNYLFPFSSPSSLPASTESSSAPPASFPYFRSGGFAVVEAVVDRRRYQGMINDDLGGSASLTA